MFPLIRGIGGITDEMAGVGLRMHHAVCRLSDWLRERWIVRMQRWWILSQDAEEGIAWTACELVSAIEDLKTVFRMSNITCRTLRLVRQPTGTEPQHFQKLTSMSRQPPGRRAHTAPNKWPQRAYHYWSTEHDHLSMRFASHHKFHDQLTKRHSARLSAAVHHD